LTVVTIRVGYTIGDEAASVRILNQIDMHLTHPTAAMVGPNGQPVQRNWNPVVQTKATEPPQLQPEPVPAQDQSAITPGPKTGSQVGIESRSLSGAATVR